MAEKKTRKHAAKPKPADRSWQARLSANPAGATVSYGESLSFDRRLYAHDIAGSIAHATMLAEVGLISEAELAAIRTGLEQIGLEIAEGRFHFDPKQEDIHMAIETALVERIGDAGRKLHTGRSRNDQVALDLRLWMRDRIDAAHRGIITLQRALLAQAERYAGALMPAYTHMQRAQPIEVGAYLLAYIEMLERDSDRFADCRSRANISPLGAGAVAGTTLPIDRLRVADLLAMYSVATNSIDATSERDVAAEFAFCCTITMLHLSRWAEDGILHSTQEFGFLTIDDAYCTSSSMMPQKRNPDLLELMRGKSAAVLGQFVGLLTLIKGLPLAYNRDLQEDKPLLFKTADTLIDSLAVAAEIVGHSRYNVDRLAVAAGGGFMDATSLAEYLVGKGIPFRKAHQAVGEIVRIAEAEGKALADLSLTQFRSASPAIGKDVYAALGPANVVAKYRSLGAAGGPPLAEQFKQWKERLA
jgi:argininosuccinate lyase